MPNKFDKTCWVCGSSYLNLIKPSDVTNSVASDSFAITGSSYGITGELHRCTECGFVECLELNDVLSFYEDLQDEEDEAGREQRSIHARKLLELVQPYCASGRLLDIGAGSGILVEQALAVGYDAEGVEPSRWFQERATSHGLTVHFGTYPLLTSYLESKW